MLGYIFVFSLFTIICLRALYRPGEGVIGYYCFMLLQPEWNWRWSVPADFQCQKYIAGATLIGAVLSGLRGNRLRGTPLVACIALACFLGIGYLSANTSIHPQRSEWLLNVLWKVVLMGLLGIKLIHSPKQITLLLWVCLLAIGYNAYQINMYYFQDGYCRFVQQGWGSSGLNNNTYSILAVPGIGIGLALSVCSEQWWQKIIAFANVVLLVHLIMLLESRGCMIGAVVIFGLFFVFMPKNRATVSLFVVIVLAGVLLAGPSVVKEFTSSFQSSENLDSSAESRFALWEAGYNLMWDYPTIGVGPGASIYIVPQYYPGGLDVPTKALHNLFFEVTTEFGIPAALCYFLFFGVIWLACARRYKIANSAQTPKWAQAAMLSVLVGLPGYFVPSMFSSGMLLESSYALTVVGAATLLILRSYNAPETVLDLAQRPEEQTHSS